MVRRLPASARTVAKSRGTDKGEPEKIYYKIGEAAKLLELPQYVLRYWETEFSQLRPRKTGSGRRIYSRSDIELLRRLRKLLHEERYTIEGARRVLAAPADGDEGEPSAGAEVPRSELVNRIELLRRDLEALKELVARPIGPRTR